MINTDADEGIVLSISASDLHLHLDDAMICRCTNHTKQKEIHLSSWNVDGRFVLCILSMWNFNIYFLSSCLCIQFYVEWYIACVLRISPNMKQGPVNSEVLHTASKVVQSMVGDINFVCRHLWEMTRDNPLTAKKFEVIVKFAIKSMLSHTKKTLWCEKLS